MQASRTSIEMMLYRVVDEQGNWVATGHPQKLKTYLAHHTALGVATLLSTERRKLHVQHTQIHWEDVNGNGN